MPDFRTRRTIPTQQIIDTYGRDPLTETIQGGLKGFSSGMELAESMRVVKEKRQRAKQMAEMMQSPEMKQLVRESGIPAGMIQGNEAVFIQSLLNSRNRKIESPAEQVNPNLTAPEGFEIKSLDENLKPTGYIPKKQPPKIEKTIEEKAAEAAAIAAAKEKAVRTADQKNAIITTKQVKENIKELEGLAKKLKGGWAGWSEEKLGQASRGKFQKEYLEYERFRPAYAVSLYRALTGDTRLSDADAAARALPLLWDAKIDERLRQPMFDRVKRALWEREQMLNQGVNNAPENTNLGEIQKILNPIQPPVGGQPQGQKQGGVEMTDAQGNRAIVYPDGSFEEIK